MKKRFTILFIICIFIIGIFLVYNNISYEGYEVNKIKEEILVDGIKLDNSKYEFNTVVEFGFGDEENLLSSILQLNLITEMKFDEMSNKYILKNADLNITPIIGNIYSIDQKNIEGNIFTQNLETGVEVDQCFNQVMEVGYAKLLLENENVVVNEINSYSNFNINSKKDLKKIKDNSELIIVNYNNLENNYKSWYRITFEITPEGQGIFKAF